MFCYICPKSNKMKIYSGSIDLQKLISSLTTSKSGESVLVIKRDQKGLYIGKKGTYLNIKMVVRDEKDKHGNDAFIAIEQSKEEREAGDDPIYLGNAKLVFEKNSQDGGARRADNEGKAGQGAPTDSDPDLDDDDDLPF